MSCPKCVIRNQRMLAGNDACRNGVPTSLDDPYQKMLAERAKQDTMWNPAPAAAEKNPTVPTQTKYTTEVKR